MRYHVFLSMPDRVTNPNGRIRVWLKNRVKVHDQFDMVQILRLVSFLNLKIFWAWKSTNPLGPEGTISV